MANVQSQLRDAKYSNIKVASAHETSIKVEILEVQGANNTTHKYEVVTEFPQGYSVYKILDRGYLPQEYILIAEDSPEASRFVAYRVESANIAMYLNDLAGDETITADNIEGYIQEFKRDMLELEQLDNYSTLKHA